MELVNSGKPLPVDVVIVSAFGRGHWLAAELQREKISVLLVDLTSRLGVWPSEDVEGPFGFFRLERYADSFVERWTQDDPIEMVPHGLTLWLDDGPLEFKGPLTRHHLQAKGFDEKWNDLMAKGGSLRDPEAPRPQGQFLNEWPLILASQLASTTFRPAAKALQGGRLLPLAANFGVRFATRQGLRRNLDWLRDKGVRITDQSEILDVVRATRGELSGFELKGELSGLVKAEQMIWTLTAGETRFVSEKLAEKLFPGGVVAPRWCWVRYRLTVEPCAELDLLPIHFVCIRDLESPWTHENFLVIQKTPIERNLDAWIRIPALQRFNKDYLRDHGRRIRQEILTRLPTSMADLQDLPQEASYTTQELGDPRIPVWELGQDPTSTRGHWKNLHYESIENRENHSFDSEFDHQRELRDRLLKWHELKLLKLQKQQKEIRP